MKKILIFWFLILSVSATYAQQSTNDFKTKVIGKEVKAYTLKIDLTTPLRSFLSMQYILANGKESLWKEISSTTIMNRLPVGAPDKVITPQRKEEYLHYTLLEVITYKESTAAVIAYTNTPSDPYYLIYWCKLEDGKWKNKGQDPANTIEDARKQVEKKASNF